MQVHAVPDAERVHDSLGRQLPWGFDYADSEHNQRRIPEEKGPFGKSSKGRLSKSRSKTATPARNVDQAKLDNLRTIDDIFSSFRNEAKAKENQQSIRKPGGLVTSQSAPLLDATAGNAAGGTQQPVSTEPTPVILYGYGNDLQWAAIDFFEKVSNGFIYEEYERNPSNQKYNLSLSHHRSIAQRNLTKDALRKTNQFIGGDHWIKITFNSPEAAERACYYSPHTIHGYQVFAERYRGVGPNVDVAVPAGGQGHFSSLTGSPNPSSTTLPAGTQSQSSETASSATATASIPASIAQSGSNRGAAGGVVQSQGQGASTSLATGAQRAPARQPTLRVKAAKLGKLLPAEQALLPSAPRWQQTMRSFPVVGWVFGSGHEIIGNQVPRKADGAFDSDGASVYWKFWYMIDSCFGTDFCGVRADEDD